MNRYQTVSGLMALVAVFLVVVGFNYLKVDLNLKPGHESGNLSFESDDDWDNDGLNNREESYWNTDPNDSDSDGDGYLDGEEVASNHDPLIPAPDDLIDNDNLTDKLSRLTLAGLYEGSLKTDNPNYVKYLDDMTSEVLSQVFVKSALNISKIKTASPNKNNQEKYAQEISVLIKKASDIFDSEMSDLLTKLEIIGQNGFDNEIISYFNSKKGGLEEIFETGGKMNVPQNWLQQHIYFLKTVSTFIETNKLIASGSKDPIHAAIALNNLPNLIDQFTKMVSIYAEKLALSPTIK